MSPTVVLITGANRGIGKGLLGLYLLKPDHLIIAANRDPEDSTSKDLADLPTANGTSLLVIKIDATVRTANRVGDSKFSTYVAVYSYYLYFGVVLDSR
jgi:norsolorinic acid ketoreductase